MAMVCGGSSVISAIARAREEKGGTERRRGLSRGSALLSALAQLPAIGRGGRCCSGEYRGRATGLTARRTTVSGGFDATGAAHLRGVRQRSQRRG